MKEREFNQDECVRLLRIHGVIGRAAKQMGVHRETIRYHRITNPEFDKRVQRAIHASKTVCP